MKLEKFINQLNVAVKFVNIPFGVEFKSVENDKSVSVTVSYTKEDFSKHANWLTVAITEGKDPVEELSSFVLLGAGDEGLNLKDVISGSAPLFAKGDEKQSFVQAYNDETQVVKTDEYEEFLKWKKQNEPVSDVEIED